MLPVMVGCTHNKCKFCGLFKHLDFRVLPFCQIEEEVNNVSEAGGNPEVVFLGDGNAFSLPTSSLLRIVELLNNKFSNLKHINMDATVQSILTKSDRELRLLAEAKIYNLYLGIECGLDDVLEFMNKGNNLGQASTAITRLQKFGMVYSAHIMSGVAGRGRGEENARSLARFFNKNEPLNICNFDLGMHRSVELWNDYENGQYIVASPQERLQETKLLIQLLKPCGEIKYDGVFEVPPVRFTGLIPKDRDRLLLQIDDAINNYDGSDDVFCIWE